MPEASGALAALSQRSVMARRCEITTREYCSFMHGHFHEDATLCSQVGGGGGVWGGGCG